VGVELVADGAAVAPAADRDDDDVLPLLDGDGDESGDEERAGDGSADAEGPGTDSDAARDVGAGSTTSGTLMRVSSGRALPRSGFS
jgi:hypothetical protein